MSTAQVENVSIVSFHLTMAYTLERDAAVHAARAAAKLIRQHAGAVAEEEVDKKAKNDLVTFADHEAQKIIIEQLRIQFPEYGVLAEEEFEDADGSDAEAAYRWVIDPIDGTTNFAHGLPPYAVSIALEDRQAEEIVVGVVLEVSRSELFTAVRGEGLYVNGVRHSVSRQSKLSESLVTTGFPFKEFTYVDQYLETFKKFLHDSQGVRRPGSASIDLAYVACGRFEGFFEVGLSPWDLAAGALLVAEGGGRVTDMDGRSDDWYDGKVCASNGRIHQAMLDRVTALRDVSHLTSR